METITLQTSLGPVEITPFDLKDIEAQLSYLFDSPKEYLESIGYDPVKFQSRELMRERITKLYSGNSEKKPTTIAARLNGRTIAATFLNTNPEPRAHFHILDASLRGLGLGKPVFCASLKLLFKIHNLKYIWIEPKSDNQRMNALMKKCGFIYEGPSLAKQINKSIVKYKTQQHS